MISSIEDIYQIIGQNSALNRSTMGLDIGVISLVEVDRLMRKLTQWRLEDQIPDTLLLLSHPPSLAVGARELNQADLLLPLSYFENQGIYLYKNIRGGGLTYHWQGQLVCYPILKLKPNEQNISNYMYRLEEVGLRTLKDLGIVAERKREKTAQIGLWLGNNKIASMGVHISKWVTSWGFALNLYGDKSPADFIRPCGLEEVNLITVEEVMRFKPPKLFAMNRLVYHFGEVFDRKVEFSNNKKQITNKFQMTNHNSQTNLEFQYSDFRLIPNIKFY